ncbi:MAG: phosphate starvation-inducible protein PsiF [Proteobacteria bacterium]|nr:phosphate starvation-inducible protein PsiF [Pseudomonadota bacterium]
MKATTMLAATGLLLLSMSVQAQNAQQEKMKTCNAQAKEQTLSGAARKSFMKTCLSNQPAADSKLNSQQQKMKQCNADAKTQKLTGADRKSFMSTCLKG